MTTTQIYWLVPNVKKLTNSPHVASDRDINMFIYVYNTRVKRQRHWRAQRLAMTIRLMFDRPRSSRTTFESDAIWLELSYHCGPLLLTN